MIRKGREVDKKVGVQAAVLQNADKMSEAFQSRIAEARHKITNMPANSPTQRQQSQSTPRVEDEGPSVSFTFIFVFSFFCVPTSTADGSFGEFTTQFYQKNKTAESAHAVS